MGRRLLPLVLVLVLVGVIGCKKQEAAVEPVAPPVASPAEKEAELDADLKKFLDGMLITSNERGSDETVWPVDDGSMQYRIKAIAQRSFRIETDEALKAAFARSAADASRGDAYLDSRLSNDPRAQAIWERLSAEDPLDAEAAADLGTYTELLEGAEVAMKKIATADAKAMLAEEPRAIDEVVDLQVVRCKLSLALGKFDEARAFCAAAQALNEDRGGLYFATALLGSGKKTEALRVAEEAMKVPQIKAKPEGWLTLGMAQQGNGLAEKATATWAAGLQRWPGYEPLQRVAAGSLYGAGPIFNARRAWEKDLEARELATCGYVMAELELTDQSKACYAASEHLVPNGPALAHQLVFLSRTNPEEAFTKLKAANANGTPHVNLQSALAYVLYHQGKLPEARAVLEATLGRAFNDPKSMQLMWQVCGKQADYLCVIEYRKRLGLPTHFDQAKYRDVARAWKEQAEKNGVGLAAQETAPSTPVVGHRDLKLIPVTAVDAPELEGMAERLTKRFPGVKVTLAAREDPTGLTLSDDWVAPWEKISERLREETGAIFVIDHDLLVGTDHFAFEKIDFPNGRAVVSIARLRSLTGRPVPPGLIPPETVIPAVQHRAEEVLANVVGKLAGLSFPCDEVTCPLHARRSVKELSAASGPLCAKHTAELAKMKR